MRKWIVGLILLVTLCIASQAKAQSIVQTYLDPCDSKVYIVNVPLNSTGVVVIIRGKSNTFSYAQFQSGEVSLWVASIFAIPCSLPPAVAQTIQTTVTQAATTASPLCKLISIPLCIRPSLHPNLELICPILG